MHPAQHVERTIAVERRDLDGDDIADLGKAPPEIGAEDHTADRGLQIEADQRNFLRYISAMRDDLVLAGRFHRGEAEQPGVIADAARGPGFAHRLSRRAREAGDQRQRALCPVRCRLGRKLQYGPVKTDIADCELRGVDADREPTGAGIDVVTRQRALMHMIELAVGIEREWMRGQHRALGDQAPYLGLDLAVMHGVFYPNSGPATANGNSAPCVVARPKRMRWNGRSMVQPLPVRPLRNWLWFATASIRIAPCSLATMFATNASAAFGVVAKSGPI